MFQPYGVGIGFRPVMFPAVRLRGLPFNCSEIDVYKFFAGLDIVDVLLVTKDDSFTGEAFVVFAGPMQSEMALQRNRQNLGKRYIEVFGCKKSDYYNAVANEVGQDGSYDDDNHPHNRRRGSNPPPPPPQARPKLTQDKEILPYTEVLRLRGLPFSVTKTDIIEFFEDFNLGEDKIYIGCRPDGRATGDAYVEFSSVDEAKSAMRKDKMLIGSRYVELFPSVPDEAKRAGSGSRSRRS
ncbi:heterogeneous nuclear ribonucleoprotein H3 isoform X2 [Impatiens glandulifera]|nr:heterogeneous nuclear ribonucleoprotein H3 isoform X2 [Impatiens glandulifera]